MIVHFLRILRFNHNRFNTSTARFINLKVKYKWCTSSCPLLIDKLKNIVNPRRNNSRDYSPGMLSGLDIMHNARYNQGMCFTIEERMTLGIHGLLPPGHRTPDDQVAMVLESIDKLKNPINKHAFMMELLERNERLFFRILTEFPNKTMPLVYTPTVGQACLEFGSLFRRPRGMFISIDDKGHISQVLQNWPEPNVRVICVTDGERILGLGDLGAHGMPIPCGKLALYTSLGGIRPHLCLPIVLDVGTNNETLLDDPSYVGLRRHRPNDFTYYSFLDEFMAAVVERYGQNTLIQFEDFANHHAFKLLDRYQHRYCTFNDDIQGTASVAVAGLLASTRITGTKPADYKVLFFGAGEAACGIAHLLVYTMVKEGVVKEKALEKVWMIDINGLVVKNRPEGMTDSSSYFAQDYKPMKDLLEIVKEVKPNVLIGVSAVGKAFTKEILHEMAAINKRPVVFALSNPTSKAECTALEAYTHTQGRVVFSSGSPFEPVEVHGKKFRPGQGNNAYIFPGVGLGILASGMHHVTSEIFLISAKTVAEYVSETDIASGALYPPLKEILKVSVEMATNIVKYAYEKELASTYPEPQDKKAYVKKMLYDYFYKSPVPEVYNRKSKCFK